MVRDRPFVRADEHEYLIRLREEPDELPVMGKELLSSFVTGLENPGINRFELTGNASTSMSAIGLSIRG